MNAYRNSLIDLVMDGLVSDFDHWLPVDVLSFTGRPLLLNAVPRGRFLKLIPLLLTAQQWMHFRHSCNNILYLLHNLLSIDDSPSNRSLAKRRRFFVGDTSGSPSTDRLMNGGHVTDAFINVKCGMNSSAGQRVHWPWIVSVPYLFTYFKLHRWSDRSVRDNHVSRGFPWWWRGGGGRQWIN